MSCFKLKSVVLFLKMNNSVFGKTMENLRKRINVKCISTPGFASQKIFSKNSVALHEVKPVLTLNKPSYLGFRILDLSKYLMYEFHYKYIKSKFNAKLLLSDTDRLDFYHLDKNLFEFSDYPLVSNFFDPANRSY